MLLLLQQTGYDYKLAIIVFGLIFFLLGVTFYCRYLMYKYWLGDD